MTYILYQCSIYKIIHFKVITESAKKGGGTSMYIHKSVQYKLRIDLARQYSNFESLFIEIPNRVKIS